MTALDHHSDGKSQSPPPDRLIAAVAYRQHGVVARRQLFELGLGRGAIERRLSKGRLHTVFRGVYAVGHERISVDGRRLAAVLACGMSAVLSHRTTADQLGIRESASPLIEVTVTARGHRGPRGIKVHWTRRLDPEDVQVVGGIPLTSPSRTLLDLAGVLGVRDLERAVENADRLALLDLAAVDRVLARMPGRAGAAELASVLDDYSPEGRTRSQLERDFLALCRDAGLPPPVVNAQIAGLEVDVLWEEAKLVVELDGHRFHTGRAAFERDRRRDATLMLHGYRVLRLTHRRVSQEPAAVIAELRFLIVTEPLLLSS